MSTRTPHLLLAIAPALWLGACTILTDGDGSDTGPGDISFDGERYHPDGYAASEVHGLAAKMQDEVCTDCHGMDLAGGSVDVGCDECHLQGWRTDCTYCHGGAAGTSGAPPRDIAGDDRDDWSHAAHAGGAVPHFDCAECHVQPTDVLSSGHLFVDDLTPERAEVDFSAGLSSTASWDGNGTCSNMYCHGDGRTRSGAVGMGDAVACNTCHASQNSSASAFYGMSGKHAKHMIGEGITCSECHGSVVGASGSIVSQPQHVDGTVEVTLNATLGSWDPGSQTCNGLCHFKFHFAEGW